MSRDEGLGVLRACLEEYDLAADQALVENLGYAEVIQALTDALLGEWDDDYTVH